MPAPRITIVRQQPVPALHVVKAAGSRTIKDSVSGSVPLVPTRKVTRELGGRLMRPDGDSGAAEATHMMAFTSATAARRWAKSIGKSVHRVELDQIAGKYIGETEKNLAAAFAAAEKADAVLLLDEADAIFGKRTGVRDAHDKYANVEVSYLLQRMEEQGGVVVLSANRKTNLDPAFLRRLRFIERPTVAPSPRKKAARTSRGSLRTR